MLRSGEQRMLAGSVRVRDRQLELSRRRKHPRDDDVLRRGREDDAQPDDEQGDEEGSAPERLVYRQSVYSPSGINAVSGSMIQLSCNLTMGNVWGRLGTLLILTSKGPKRAERQTSRQRRFTQPAVWRRAMGVRRGEAPDVVRCPRRRCGLDRCGSGYRVGSDSGNNRFYRRRRRSVYRLCCSRTRPGSTCGCSCRWSSCGCCDSLSFRRTRSWACSTFCTGTRRRRN